MSNWWESAPPALLPVAPLSARDRARDALRLAVTCEPVLRPLLDAWGEDDTTLRALARRIDAAVPEDPLARDHLRRAERALWEILA
jgi:hypothetical protein